MFAGQIDCRRAVAWSWALAGAVALHARLCCRGSSPCIALPPGSSIFRGAWAVPLLVPDLEDVQQLGLACCPTTAVGELRTIVILAVSGWLPGGT